MDSTERTPLMLSETLPRSAVDTAEVGGTGSRQGPSPCAVMESERTGSFSSISAPSVDSSLNTAQSVNNDPRDTRMDLGLGLELENPVMASVSSFVRSVDSRHDPDGGADDLEEYRQVSDQLMLVQACVFIEDARAYHTVHHRIDMQSLALYRFYYSWPVQWLLYITLFVLLMLAFFENPSSLTATSDIRTRGDRMFVPCGITECIEFLCLLILLSDLVIKSYLKGHQQLVKSRWLMAAVLILLISFIDWGVSVGKDCQETVRVRRMLRPFFLMANSSLMKKTVNCLRKTLPQVVSVLVLLLLHLYFFALFGMLLFPKEVFDTPIGNNTKTGSTVPDEYSKFFPNLVDSFINLLVLLTTANNPDVAIPAYSRHRLYAIFFIVFLVIGLYCLMNMLTAVIYNQFRGYFSDSIQSSLFRRRLGIRAAFEVLRTNRIALKYSSSFLSTSIGVSVVHVKMVVGKANICSEYKDAMVQKLDKLPDRLLDYNQFLEVFSIMDLDLAKSERPEIREVMQPCLRWLQRVCVHRAFNYFGCFVAFANVVCITLELALEYDHIRNSRDTYLGIFNLAFVGYFLIEQILKLWALGLRRYWWEKGNVFDGVVTAILVIVEIIYVATYGIPFWGKDHQDNRGITLWDLVRVINMLIMIRLLRIVSQIKAMAIVASTLFDLVKNLRAFAGILVVIYYSYALLGMELFHDKIKYTPPGNGSQQNLTAAAPCGSYQQLEYYANNFDDFAAALVVLWDIMVVNNWHVFLNAYSEAVSKWALVYFIVWWLMSVVISLNLFTALILENFIMRWDRQQQSRRDRSDSFEESFRYDYLTVHDLFRGNLQEPSEESLIVELRQHPFLQGVS